MANFSLMFETALIALISYVKVFNIGLGTRAIACAHFAIPTFAYFTLAFFYDETRKIFVRKGVDRSVKGKVKYTGWLARNTLY